MTLRTLALGSLALALSLVLAPSEARTDCALIPPAVKVLLSDDGGVDRPFVAPGDAFTVFSDRACKPAASEPHFDPVAANNQLTVIFQPPTGGTAPAVPPVGASSVSDCGTSRCFAAKFTMPDTTGLAGTDGADQFPLTGPARLEVRNTAKAGNPLVAVVDDLFDPAKGCNKQNRVRHLIRDFTVLSKRNAFPAAGIQTLDAAVDGTGALLIPFDFEDVLVEAPGGTGTLRLLEVAGDLVHGLTDAGDLAKVPDPTHIRIPEKGGYARAFFFNGRPIPPLLEVTASTPQSAGGNAFGDQLLGSVDFIESVIRIASIGDPGTGPVKIFQVGPGGLDLASAVAPNPGVSGGVGPVRLPGVMLTAKATAKLNSLKASKRLAVVARDERLEAKVAGGSANQNADADQDDQVVEFTDLETGEVFSTGQTVLEIGGKAFIATKGDTVAFLQSEAHQTSSNAARVDLNGDDDAWDGIFRVWTADGSHPSCSGAPCELTTTPMVADMNLRIQGPTGLPSPVVVSGPPGDEDRYVWFGRSEQGETPLAVERISLTASGGETAVGSSSIAPTVSGDGVVVAYISDDYRVAFGTADGYYRIVNPGGALIRYPTFADLVGDSNGASVGGALGWEDDADFFWDGSRQSFIRVTAAGQILEYTSPSDFFGSSGAVVQGTVPGYGDDAGFFRDDDRGTYVRIENPGGAVIEYFGFADFASGASPNVQGGTLGYEDDAGFFRDPTRGTYVRVTAAGQVLEYASFNDLESATGSTILGTVAGYADDAGFFFAGPEFAAQAFARNTFTDTNDLLSANTLGHAANSPVEEVALDEDGDVAAFVSFATNLDGANPSSFPQVFVRDRNLATTVRASEAPGGGAPDGPSRNPIVSGDGSTVVYASSASNLVSPAPAPGWHVYLYDVGSGINELLSDDVIVSPAPGQSLGVSRDGNYVAYPKDDPDALPIPSQIFLQDRAAGTNEQVSVGFGGADPDAGSGDPHLSADGRFIAFSSAASNLLSPGDDALSEPGVDPVQCFVFDRLKRSTELVSRTLAGQGANGSCQSPFISLDGRFVTFSTPATNLFPFASTEMVYVHDRLSGVTTLASRASLNVPSPNVFSPQSAIGLLFKAVVVFDTYDPLVGDSNGSLDVYAIFQDFDDPGAVSFNQGTPWFDFDVGDTVLHVFDTQTGTVVNTGIPVNTGLDKPVAVAGSRAAVVTNQLPNVHVWDAATGTRTERASGGTPVEVAMTESILCTALESIGYVYAGHPAGAGTLNGSLDPGTNLAASGGRCVFIETGSRLLRSVDEFGAFTTLGETAEDFQLGDDGIAFRSCESLEGDLNLDVDVADCAMRWWYFDPPAPPLAQLVETRQAARPCTFLGCDPFFEPYRVGPGIISFVTSEVDEVNEGGSGARGVSCLASSPVGGCDKTGDGDGDDVAIEVFNLASLRSQVFPVSASNPPAVPPFPTVLEGNDGDTGVMTVQLPAALAGEAFAGLPPDQPVTLIVGDPDGDFVFEADGNRNRKTTVTDRCQQVANPEQVDADADGLGEACDFVLDTATANDDPDTAPEPAQIPGEDLCDLDKSGVISRAEVDQVWADRGTPIDEPFDRDTPPDLVLDPADDRDRDVDGEVSAVDFSLCLADCSAQPVGPGNPNGGCPLTETTPTVGGGYKNKGCGLLGIEALLVLAPIWARRRRRMRR